MRSVYRIQEVECCSYVCAKCSDVESVVCCAVCAVMDNVKIKVPFYSFFGPPNLSENLLSIV